MRVLFYTATVLAAMIGSSNAVRLEEPQMYFDDLFSELDLESDATYEVKFPQGTPQDTIDKVMSGIQDMKSHCAPGSELDKCNSITVPPQDSLGCPAAAPAAPAGGCPAEPTCAGGPAKAVQEATAKKVADFKQGLADEANKAKHEEGIKKTKDAAAQKKEEMDLKV